MTRVYKNYDCSLDQVQEYLDKYGVAVIPDVLKLDELITIREKMFTTLTDMTKNFDVPFQKNEPTSWKTIFNMKPLHGMLFQTFALGHAQFAWDIRQHPQVNSIFAKLWNVQGDELLSSFDGVTISLPPEITGKGWHIGDWYHSDQRFSNNNLHTIQGFINCYDIEEGDGTLTVLESSNKYHKTFAEKFGMTNHSSDWYRLKDNEIDFYNNLGCQKIYVKAKAGSLVLWDSRTIHAGSGPLQDRAKQNTRLVVYVCQKPRIYASAEDIDKKIKAFENQVLTSHDPCNVRLFDKFSMRSKKIIREKVILPDEPVLTELGRKLIGF